MKINDPITDSGAACSSSPSSAKGYARSTSPSQRRGRPRAPTTIRETRPVATERESARRANADRGTEAAQDSPREPAGARRPTFPQLSRTLTTTLVGPPIPTAPEPEFLKPEHRLAQLPRPQATNAEVPDSRGRLFRKEGCSPPGVGLVAQTALGWVTLVACAARPRGGDAAGPWPGSGRPSSRECRAACRSGDSSDT